MSSQTSKFLKFGSAMVAIQLALGYLAYTGVQESKSYYVTIKELHGMGDGAYTKRLRVAGNVQPGSIRRSGTSFALTGLRSAGRRRCAGTHAARRAAASRSTIRCASLA